MSINRWMENMLCVLYTYTHTHTHIYVCVYTYIYDWWSVIQPEKGMKALATMYIDLENRVVVWSPSCVWLFVTPWTAAAQASLSLTISWNLPQFMFIASVMPSSHLILWHPLLLLPSIFSSYRDFSNESSVCIRWPKYWSFSFSISLSIEYSGLISLNTDWFDLLAIQGIFRNLLQHHSLKASGINSLAFCLLYGPVLTRVCNHWEDHQFSSVQFSCSVVSDSSWCHGLQHARPPCPSPTPGFTQTHVYLVGDAIQPSPPLSSPSPPTFNLSQHQGLLKWVSSLHQVAEVLEFYLQHQSFQWIFRTDFLKHGLVGSPCSPLDSQESSPTPQFQNINSLALSFLYSPTLTSIHEYWKNHSLD